MERVTMSIQMNAPIVCKCNNFLHFKKFINGENKRLPLNYNENKDKYDLFCIDGSIVYTFFIEDGVEGFEEFKSFWKEKANKETVSIFREDDSGGAGSNAFSKKKSFVIPIKANTNPSILVWDVPYDCFILSGGCSGLGVTDWDKVNFWIEPKGSISSLKESVVSGNKKIKIDKYLPIQTGFYLKIGNVNGSGYEETYYEIKKYNPETGDVFLVEELKENKTTEAQIFLRISFLEDLYLRQSIPGKLGGEKKGGKKLKEGWQTVAEITHKITPTEDDENGFPYWLVFVIGNIIE